MIEIEHFVEAWRGPLVGLLRARGLGEQAAIELAQDVFAEAWLGCGRFTGSASDEVAVGAWLAGIARNLHRARQRERTGLELAEVAATEPEVDERIALIRSAIDDLPDSEREVVRMFYLEETSTRRVAALLEISERAVEGRLRRARIRLADALHSVELNA